MQARRALWFGLTAGPVLGLVLTIQPRQEPRERLAGFDQPGAPPRGTT